MSVLTLKIDKKDKRKAWNGKEREEIRCKK